MILFLKNLAFTIIVPCTVAVFLPYRMFGPYNPWDGSVASMGVGGLLIIAGLLLYIACVWPFARIGRGTPAPIAAPVRLVVAGPYRFVRNPMYLAVLSVIFGQAIFLFSSELALYGLGVFIVFFLVVIGYEEPALKRKFRGEYDDYRRRVPRWIPRILKTKPPEGA